MGFSVSKEYDMAQIEQIVEEIIKTNKIAVFSKSYCPYCVKAKQLLRKLGKEFFVIELDQKDDGAAIQQYLLELTGQRTVPSIFVNGTHIGGCDDLFSANDSGKFMQLYVGEAK